MEELLTKLLGSLVEGSITYGPYATFVTYLWISERSERREAQKEIETMYAEFGKEKDLLNERMFKALGDTTQAVSNTGAVVNSALQTMMTVKDLMLGRPFRKSDDGSHE
jgi:hypothetical protein